MAKTATYDFVKASLGQPVRDVDIGANLDRIDTSIKARADSITALRKGIVTTELSFDAGRQTATKIYFPYAVTVTKIRAIVMKDIGDIDEGTITGANSVGNSANGVLTVEIAAGLNDEYSVVPTSHNHVETDSYYKLTSSKPTPGGDMLVTLEYIRTD